MKVEEKKEDKTNIWQYFKSCPSVGGISEVKLLLAA